MKMAKQVEEPVLNVEEKFTRWEQKFEENKKSYTLIGGIILLVVVLYFGWVRFYVAPREKEAQEEILFAEKYFEVDSLDKAMYGDAEHLGFADIAEDYGFTDAGNLANYYMGISLLRKGDYEQAIEFLNEFDSDDEILGPIAEGAIGDAYAELGDHGQAVDHYLAAAEARDNAFTAPIYYLRAGILLEQMGDYQRAVDTYRKIEEKYAESTEGRDIEKYIARASSILNSR